MFVLTFNDCPSTLLLRSARESPTRQEQRRCRLARERSWQRLTSPPLDSGFWEKIETDPPEILKFPESETRISVGVGKIDANNQFYSKAYPTPRPPLAALSEGVSAFTSGLPQISATLL